MTRAKLRGFTVSDLAAMRLGLQAALCFYGDRPSGASNADRVQGLIRDLDGMLNSAAPAWQDAGFAMPPPGEARPVLVFSPQTLSN